MKEIIPVLDLVLAHFLLYAVYLFPHQMFFGDRDYVDG